MASTKITRTPSSVGNSKTWTYSMWIKLANIGTEYVLFHNYGSSNTSEVYAKIGGSSGVIEFALRYSGTYEGRLITNRLFRDPSSWYHLVFVCDTTSATATNRQRIYVNGVEETSFSTDTHIAQNAGTVFNQAHEHTIGSYGSGNYFDGEMAHVHMTDGTAYTASTFGETDSVSGIWKPKTAPSVTYGTNGFFLKFENAGNMDLDSSGNNLTFATSGTLTQNVDTPSNNFATINPLPFHHWSHMQSMQNGNTTLTTGSGSEWKTALSTMGLDAGKWYFEAKLITNGTNAIIGAVDINDQRQNSSSTWYIGQSSTGQGYQNNGAAANGGASYGATYTNNDIIGVAMDLDNSKIYFHKNGTYQNSGVPTSGSTGTGAMSLTANTIYTFALTGYAGTVWNINYGSGYFGTTAVASANADANGHGAMEYAVPSGYYTLNTKNLKEFG